jgi:hypothetical protein
MVVAARVVLDTGTVALLFKTWGKVGGIVERELMRLLPKEAHEVRVFQQPLRRWLSVLEYVHQCLQEGASATPHLPRYPHALPRYPHSVVLCLTLAAVCRPRVRNCHPGERFQRPEDLPRTAAHGVRLCKVRGGLEGASPSCCGRRRRYGQKAAVPNCTFLLKHTSTCW